MSTVHGLLVFNLTACSALGTPTPTWRQETPSQPRVAVRIVRAEIDTRSSIDPYRWMEDVESREFQAWARGQNACARAMLDRLKLRGKWLARIRALAACGDETKTIKARARMGLDSCQTLHPS